VAQELLDKEMPVEIALLVRPTIQVAAVAALVL
jgi:hypothetical protein